VSTGFLSGRIALKKFPELDGLNKMQRLVILNYLQTNYGSVSHSRLTEVGMVGIIILGEISGLVAGWICMPGVVGPVMGASVALLLLMGSFAAVNSLVLRYITLPRIHDFLHSRAGQELIDGTIDLYGF
jgi:hypothetical protein